jgi:hypothetical protein
VVPNELTDKKWKMAECGDCCECDDKTCTKNDDDCDADDGDSEVRAANRWNATFDSCERSV